MSNDIVLAVDLGGTNLRMAAVDRDGRILARVRDSSPKGGGPAELLVTFDKLAGECRAVLAAGQQVVGIGAGIPANVVNGPVRNLPNLREIEGMDLKADLEARFGVPVALENDATAAAIGENWLGASKDVRDSIMITLGTGVGGGIIIDNEPLRGIDGTAGKLGHICVEPDGHPCKCGSKGEVTKAGTFREIQQRLTVCYRRCGVSVRVAEIYEDARRLRPRAGRLFSPWR